MTDIKAKCSHTKQCGALDFDICLKKVRLVKYWLRICPNGSQLVYLTRNIVLIDIYQLKIDGNLIDWPVLVH